MITLIHRLRRHLFHREPAAGRAAGTLPAPDRHFASRLVDTVGSAPASPEGFTGYVGPEPRLRIPFRLAPGDGEVRVIVLSDPPGLLAMAIEKPDGTLLEVADSESGVEWMRHGAVTTCAFALPSSARGLRGGTWHLRIAVDTRLFKQHLHSLRLRFPSEFARLAERGVFYSVSVLAARRPASAAAASPGLASEAPGSGPSWPELRRPTRTAPEPGPPWAAFRPAL